MKLILLLFILNDFALSLVLGDSMTFAPESEDQSPVYAKWTDAALTPANGLVQRTIKLPGRAGPFLTTAYRPLPLRPG